MKNNISIIIPVFNEERRIKKTYLELKSLEKDFEDKNIEIIFVDDGSTDSTQKVIENFKFEKFNKRYFSTNHSGMMSAIFFGIKNSNYDIIVTIEADMPVSLLSIKDHLLYLDNYDLIIGNRYHKKSKILNQPLIRFIVSKIFIFLYKFFFKTNFNDPQIGYKIFKKTSFNKIKDKLQINHDGLKSFLMTIQFYKHNFKIKELPVIYRYENDSKNFNFTNFIKVIFGCLIGFYEIITYLNKNK